MNEELLLTEETTTETKNFDLRSAGIGAGFGLAGAALATFGFKAAKKYLKNRKNKNLEHVDVDVEYEEVE